MVHNDMQNNGLRVLTTVGVECLARNVCVLLSAKHILGA